MEGEAFGLSRGSRGDLPVRVDHGAVKVDCERRGVGLDEVEGLRPGKLWEGTAKPEVQSGFLLRYCDFFEGTPISFVSRRLGREIRLGPGGEVLPVFVEKRGAGRILLWRQLLGGKGEYPEEPKYE